MRISDRKSQPNGGPALASSLVPPWPAQKAGLVCVDFILVLFRSEVCEGALTLGLNGDSQVISDPVDDILDFDR